jgi:Na+-transporting NADH:ubiquinone oxidoreductase subunit NqrE
MFDTWFDVFMTVMCILLVGLVCFMIFVSVNQTEVEIYSVGCEVSQMAYAEETVSRTQSKPVYKMGVRNDDFAVTLDITSNQFAQFAVGDIVEVEVTVMENAFGELYNTYKLLGPVIK